MVPSLRRGRARGLDSPWRQLSVGYTTAAESADLDTVYRADRPSGTRSAMATKIALRPPAPGADAQLAPLPDPPRIPDMQQYDRLVAVDSILRAHFAARTDVLISGQGYLRHEAGNGAERLAPDCVVAFGVDPAAIVARNGYVISEVGKPPDFVLEVASRSTGRRDYTVKRAGYAGYGVREYWRFDHTGGRYHDAALAGDRLVGGQYEPLRIHEEPDGTKWGHSAVLGLDLCWEVGELRLYDPVAEAYLPTSPELSAQYAAEQAARRMAEDRAAGAEDRAAAERAARRMAEDRAASAEGRAAAEQTARRSIEAELRRLREQLRRLQGE